MWSPCGQEGYLNVNSEVRLTPIDNKKTALLTVGAPRFWGPGQGPKGPKKHKKRPREIVSTNIWLPLGRFHRSQVLPGSLPPVAEVLDHSLLSDAGCRTMRGEMGRWEVGDVAAWSEMNGWVCRSGVRGKPVANSSRLRCYWNSIRQVVLLASLVCPICCDCVSRETVLLGIEVV